MKKVLLIGVLLACMIAPAVWFTILALGRAEGAGALVMMAAMGALSGFGFFAVASLVALFTVRSFGKAPAQVPFVVGEKPLAELRANHFLGIEGRGGTLVVTSQRLLFHPHRYNVQLEPIVIELSRIDGVVPWMTSLRVDASGRKHRFVVHEPARVAELVRELVRTPEEERAVLAPSFSMLTGAKRRALSAQS